MIPKSTKLDNTMIASKILKPSEQYSLMPRPIMLKIISKAKSTVNTMFAISCVSVSQSG